jgi:hypothetical protein
MSEIEKRFPVMEPVLYMISFSIILSFLFNRIALDVSFTVRVGFYVLTSSVGIHTRWRGNMQISHL